MDYCLWSSISNSPNVNKYVISYDVACQWHKNVWSRATSLPKNIRPNKNVMDCKFLVPKFHLPAHILECQLNFSFNTTPGVGRTDAEAVERTWAEMNAIGKFTREMGPGSRSDYINDFSSDRNWKKTIRFGEPLDNT
jgi:hypothetical protein